MYVVRDILSDFQPWMRFEAGRKFRLRCTHLYIEGETDCPNKEGRQGWKSDLSTDGGLL